MVEDEQDEHEQEEDVSAPGYIHQQAQPRVECKHCKQEERLNDKKSVSALYHSKKLLIGLLSYYLIKPCRGSRA